MGKSRQSKIINGFKKANTNFNKTDLQGVSESDHKKWGDDQKIKFVLQDSIAKTCVHILTSLVNQNMKVTSKTKKIEDLLNLYLRDVKFKRKMDSIVQNQICYGHSVIQYSIVNEKVKVFDTSSYVLVYDVIIDEFLGVFQDTYYLDPDELKKGNRMMKQFRGFLDKDIKKLVLIPGIGRAIGESLLLPAYPYVKAKHELIESLYDLVKRLGLLTVINLDFPGDIGDEDVDEFLEEIQDMIEQASPNSIWVFPTGTNVEGVKGSGESKIIESVKVMIELLDEEIRKCLFVPDTFLTSLSANRATAKEQRYLISSMVTHIRDLIEEALIDMFDEILRVNGLLKKRGIPDYKFSWGNINLPDPEQLVVALQNLADRNGMDTDTELRAYFNLGTPDKKIDNQYSLVSQGQFGGNQGDGNNIYSMMGYKSNTQESNKKSPPQKQGGI